MFAPFVEQHQASIALLILVLMFGGFVAERQPPAVVAACSAAVFMVLGFVDTDEVMSVLGNGALATIAAMFAMTPRS
jgi:Na+/H+ antiporter NhaD/arsenite permease-like protein